MSATADKLQQATMAKEQAERITANPRVVKLNAGWRTKNGGAVRCSGL
jgi:hypothetical protein